MAGTSSLLISEVVDATLPGGLPKFVELTNCGSSTVDLSQYSIGNFNNGDTTLSGGSSTLLSGTLEPGSSNVISYENGDSEGSGTFFSVYGFDPDTFELAAVTNGDDVYALFLGLATVDGSDATLIDVYGVVGTEGTGEEWDYAGGYSYRTVATSPNSTFSPSEWFFGGANSLETGDDATELAQIRALTTPGSHVCGQGSSSQSGSKTIQEIQGVVTSGNDASPLVSEAVKVENVVVTGILKGRGFYVQDGTNAHPTSPQDILNSASSGIFVFLGDATPAGAEFVEEGNIINIVGRVAEYFGETQLGSISLIERVGTETSIVNPIQVLLPFNVDGTLRNSDGAVATLSDTLEALEGMLVSIVPLAAHELVVSDYWNLDRFGQFKVCAAPQSLGRIFRYTQIKDPSASGFAESETLRKNSCIDVDDGSISENPDPLFIGGYTEYEVTSTTENFRGGNVVITLIGHLAFESDTYKLEPTSSKENLVIVDLNPRPSMPDVSSSPSNGVKLANCNVLNFFTTTIDATTEPVRGADNRAELERQEAKLKVALKEIDADIYGLEEVENRPGGQTTSQRLEQLLTEASGRAYNAVSLTLSSPGVVGNDFIKAEILYDSTKLTLLGASTLDEPSELFVGTNRSPLLASFATASGETFDVVVVHLKSKRGEGEGADADQSDGQGSWNEVRTKGIQAILNWAETDPIGTGAKARVVMGDFNAYAKEDPIKAVEEAGYVSVEDLVQPRPSTPIYSYVFDGQFGTLDYIFVNDPLRSKFKEATTWHVNSDELDYFDYNFGLRVQTAFDGTSPHRFSDHDPVIVSLDFDQEDRNPTSSSSPALITPYPRFVVLVIITIWGVVCSIH